VSAPNENTAWARVFVDELARTGLEHACIAPGSRSTPLTLALARHDDVTPHLHLDERSAGFYALGIGKATGKPACVVTTSGTAVANLHPAIVEANQAQVPVIALTADRPSELQGTDANQTIDQTRIYGQAPRWQTTLGDPNLEPQPLRDLRTTADRAIAKATGPPAGPVHVNAPFAKPLGETEPTDGVPEGMPDRAPLGWTGRDDGAPLTEIRTQTRAPSEATLDNVAGTLRDAERGIIVAGPVPDPDRLGPAVLDLAQTTGFPVLADPLSGARFASTAREHTVPHHDLLLRDEEAWPDLAPDAVLRFGRSPTSKHANRFLEHHADATQIVVDAGGVHKDHRAIAETYGTADPAKTAKALAERVDASASKDWRVAWQRRGQQTQRAVQDEQEPAFEGTVLADVAATLPEGANLFVSNSMPVRDLDAFAVPRDEQVTVHGNRGASGIDVIVSSALFDASQSEGPSFAVVVVVAFLHDRNGLFALTRKHHDIVFVVVNNDGGGIFHMLSVRDNDDFDPYFTTPHGLDVEPIAQAHGLDHHLVAPETVAESLKAALDDPSGQLLEVRTDREQNRARHAGVETRVREALRGDSP
jgi:2-succinyl-5-enolpyruvyl-6-hydroxy-3-cyclohexene-1-carboxylate synthase